MKTNLLIKIISCILVVTFSYQNIVWANPDICRKANVSTLQVPTRFMPSDAESVYKQHIEFFARAITQYIKEAVRDNYLGEFTSNPIAKHPTYRGVYCKLNFRGKHYERLEVSTGLRDSRLIIPCSIFHIGDDGEREIARYDVVFDSGYDVIAIRPVGEPQGEVSTLEESEEDPPQEGFIAEGNPDELYKALVKDSDEHPLDRLRASYVERLPGAKEALIERVNASMLRDGAKEKIRGLIAESFAGDFFEFKAVVLLNREDATEARGWLLGFNTAHTTHTKVDGRGDSAIRRINVLLKNDLPNTIGLASDVLNLIGDDEVLLQEYIFHEAICPIFTHRISRKIQEALFPKNYEGILGDTVEAHRDGELALVLKQVIWGRCKYEEGLKSAFPKEEFEEFKKQDFKGDGPQNATKFYTHYKKWYQWMKRSLILRQSRRYKRRSRTEIQGLLSRIDEWYNYVNAKIRWIWEMEVVWNRMADVLRGRDISQLDGWESDKVKGIAQELIARHKEFMGENPWAQFLKGDIYIDKALEEVYQIAGIIKIEVSDTPSEAQPVTISVAHTAEIAHEEKAADEVSTKDEASTEKAKKRRSVAGRRGPINWKGMLTFFAVTLSISYLLHLVLPVNSFTLSLAVIVPVTLFIYLIVRHFSLKGLVRNLVFILVISTLLSLFSPIPLPWLGLSVSIVIISRIILNRGSVGVSGRGVRVRAEKGGAQTKTAEESEGDTPDETPVGTSEKTAEAQGGTGTIEATTDREPSQDREKVEESLSHIKISRDLLKEMLKILALLQKDTEEDEGESEDAAKIDIRAILDALFQLEPSEETSKDKELKDTLRPLVRSILRKLEEGYDFDFKKANEKLRNWQNEDDDILASSLQYVSQEVAQGVLQSSGGEKGEMRAIQELTAEYYGIGKTRLHRIRLRMALIVIREQVAEGEMLGQAKAEDFYVLGRLEFYFENYQAAEEALEKAVAEKPDDKDYLLCLGLARHYLKRWDEARGSYASSLRLRQSETPQTELDKVKSKLTELLIKKTEQRQPIETGNRLRKGRGPALAVFPPIISLISGLTFAGFLSGISGKLYMLPIILLSLTVHELAHAYTADMFGDDGPRSKGRLTLNPFAHISIIGTIIMPLIAGFGWAKPVPITHEKLTRAQNFIVLAAGPVSNLILAAGLAGWYHLFDMLGLSIPLWLGRILLTAILVNIWLAVFNLIPLGPLDGSMIIRSLLKSPKAIKIYEDIAGIGTLALIGLAVFGKLGLLIFPLSKLIWALLDLPALAGITEWNRSASGQGKEEFGKGTGQGAYGEARKWSALRTTPAGAPYLTFESLTEVPEGETVDKHWLKQRTLEKTGKDIQADTIRDKDLNPLRKLGLIKRTGNQDNYQYTIDYERYPALRDKQTQLHIIEILKEYGYTIPNEKTEEVRQRIDEYFDGLKIIEEEKDAGAPPSILETFGVNIKKASKRMKLDARLEEIIMTPNRITTVKYDVALEGGTTKTFWGFRALQNDARGPGKGGLRWLIGEGETLEEAKQTAVGLASLMSVKNAVIGIPYGGGKGDIFVEKYPYTDKDKAHIIRGFARGLTEQQAIGTFIDVPAPDKGTDARMMAWFLDEYLKVLTQNRQIYDKGIEIQMQKVSRSNNPQETPYLDKYIKVLAEDHEGVLQGIELGVITGKPIGKGGSEGRTKATGLGGFFTLQAFLRYFAEMGDIKADFTGRHLSDETCSVLKKDISEMSIAIQGTGNVGEYNAWEFFRAGAKVTMLQDYFEGETYTLYNPDGIDLDLLATYLPHGDDGRWAPLVSLPEDFFNETGSKLIKGTDFFWKEYTDIKVPAATENQITVKNAYDVNCQIVLELANAPTTPAADMILRERGIFVIPDVLANAGGVTVSYFEWLQNIEGRYWGEVSVDKMLEERIHVETDTIIKFAKKYQVDLRTAAFIAYLARVSDAEIARNESLRRIYTSTQPYEGYESLDLEPETIEEMKKAIHQKGKFEEIIKRNEKRHTGEIEQIVDNVNTTFPKGERGFVLVSGPRTSGKMGFSNRLRSGLQAKGRKVVYIDMDLQLEGFIKRLEVQDLPEDEVVPRTLAHMKTLMNNLLSGKHIKGSEIVVERGHKLTGESLILKGDELLILEGDYVIGDEMKALLASEHTYRVFVNTAPSLKLADNWPLTSLDLRFMRHILTFHRIFGQDPLEIVKGWPKIREHDLKYVYPTWKNADITFNSYLPYELPVLKPHIEPLLIKVRAEAEEAKDHASLGAIDHLLFLLEGVPSFRSDASIPVGSIIRQFINDSLDVTPHDSEGGQSLIEPKRLMLGVSEEVELSQHFVDGVLSACVNQNKKVVLLVDKRIKSGKALNLIVGLRKLKRDPKFRELLRNLVIVTKPTESLGGIVDCYRGVEDATLFVFTPDPGRRDRNIQRGDNVIPVYIDESGFTEEGYYPLIDIITIVLYNHLIPDADVIGNLSQFLEQLRAAGREEGVVNIESVTTDAGALVFSIVPNLTQYYVDSDRTRNRYQLLLELIKSA